MGIFWEEKEVHHCPNPVFSFVYFVRFIIKNTMRHHTLKPQEQQFLTAVKD